MFPNITIPIQRSIKKKTQPTQVQVPKNAQRDLPIRSLLAINTLTLHVMFLNSNSTVGRGNRGTTLLLPPKILKSSGLGVILTQHSQNAVSLSPKHGYCCHFLNILYCLAHPM